MPDIDLLISEVLLVFSLIVVGLMVWEVSKKWLLGLVVFSILGNISFLVSADYRMFYVYHIVWLQYFALFVWPFINIFLLILYRKQKRDKNN